jgi:hypothetical protein
MSFKGKIKTVKKKVESFKPNGGCVNLSADERLSGAILPTKKEGVAFSDAFVINYGENGDVVNFHDTVVVDKDAFLVYKGAKIYQFEGLNIAKSTVLYQGKRYEHISDGNTAIMLDLTTGEYFMVETVGKVSAFFAGRLFLSDGKKITASKPLDPTAFSLDLTIDFIPYEDMGEIIALVEYCNKLHVFCEKGVVAFKEKDNAVCEVERMLVYGVKILENTVLPVLKSLLFCTTNGLYRLLGRNIYKVDEFSANSAIAVAQDGVYYLKVNADGEDKILGYIDEKFHAEFSSNDLFVVRGAVSLTKEKTDVNGFFVGVLPKNNGYKCLNSVAFNAKKQFDFEICANRTSKKFTAKAGDNKIRVGIYGDKFNIKITTPVYMQEIKDFECEYYE